MQDRYSTKNKKNREHVSLQNTGLQEFNMQFTIQVCKQLTRQHACTYIVQSRTQAC
jgi:hypothetical protein